jgi:general secretion pathway protein J
MKSGFTLLEMLVVLIIVSLVSMLLMQLLSYILYLRSQFLTQLGDLQQGEIQYHWFRSSTAAIVTDYVNGKHIFQGKSNEFSGLTLAALDARTGIPTPFTWQLKNEEDTTVLRYQNSRAEYWEVSRWLGKRGSFRYRAADGEWYTQWPPNLGVTPPQLPEAVLLLGQRRQTLTTWMVKLTEFNLTKIDQRLDQF